MSIQNGWVASLIIEQKFSICQEDVSLTQQTDEAVPRPYSKINLSMTYQGVGWAYNSGALRLRCSRPMAARRTRSMPHLMATASRCAPDGYNAGVFRSPNFR